MGWSKAGFDEVRISVALACAAFASATAALLAASANFFSPSFTSALNYAVSTQNMLVLHLDSWIGLALGSGLSFLYNGKKSFRLLPFFSSFCCHLSL